MKRMAAYAAFLALLFLLPHSEIFAQASPGSQTKAVLDSGITLYGEGDFAGALSAFSKVLADPKAGESLSEAYYWSALCYLSLGDYSAAEKAADIFQTNYPKSPRTADVQYQRGRIAFLRRDFEKALRIFQVYLDTYPNTENYSSALYWSGECLFQLGQLESAEKVFQGLIDNYPKSVKKESASYRISIIDLKYREDELLTLLKWSHEESLKTVEEFQRREKTYEQAINALQKKIADMTRDSRIAELEKQVTELTAKAQAGEKALTERDATISSLNSKLEERAALTVAGGTEVNEALANRDALLILKEEALILQEFYLNWLSESAGNAVGSSQGSVK